MASVMGTDGSLRAMSRREFVAGQIAALEPFGVVVLTNVGVTITPELGLFLSRLNFSLAFGRFAIDVEHQAVWFDETLLGEHATDDELRFTIDVVARTADEWDERITQMFGGTTPKATGQSPEADPEPPAKPGQGGYL